MLFKHKLYSLPNPSCIIEQKFSLWVEKFSRGKKKSHGERKDLTGKVKVSQRKRKSHSERKGITAKEKENIPR